MLFEPISLGPLTLPNRIVMAPMTRDFSPGGIPNQGNIDYYRRRAAGGAGLIITEGTFVDHPLAGSDWDIPVFHGDEALAGWQRVANAVHEAGGRIFPQLWHQGMSRTAQNKSETTELSISPSDESREGRAISRAMTQGDIDDVIEAFAKAAADAQRLGFDGVELHAGHGYLIDQFFWDKTNRRTDRYGGDLRQRTRFAVELISEIKRRTGSDFPLSMRISQWKQQDYAAVMATSIAEWAGFLEPMVDAGVDIFHVSTRRYKDPAFEGSPDTLSRLTKQITGKCVISVGSVGLTKAKEPGWETDVTLSVEAERGVDELEERLSRGDFDMIALGRVLLANPAWGELIQANRVEELVPYTLAHRDRLF